MEWQTFIDSESKLNLFNSFVQSVSASCFRNKKDLISTRPLIKAVLSTTTSTMEMGGFSKRSTHQDGLGEKIKTLRLLCRNIETAFFIQLVPTIGCNRPREFL